MLLSQKELDSASLRTVVEVAVRHHLGQGYSPWSDTDIKAYMRAQRRKTWGGLIGDTLGEETGFILAGGVVLLAAGMSLLLYASLPAGYGSPKSAAASLFLAIAAVGLSGIGRLLRGTSWQIQLLREDGMYYRDNVRQAAPPQIRRLAETLAGMTSKTALLRVAFIGEDPILWIRDNYEEVAAAVWDELPDGSIRIVAPPQPR